MNDQVARPQTDGEKSVKALSKNQKGTFDKLPSKSAKIRYLNSLDWSRSEIAKELGIRYQHVRNVLITPINQKA